MGTSRQVDTAVGLVSVREHLHHRPELEVHRCREFRAPQYKWSDSRHRYSRTLRALLVLRGRHRNPLDHRQIRDRRLTLPLHTALRDSHLRGSRLCYPRFLVCCPHSLV